MKKILAMILTLVAVLSLFAGCAPQDSTDVSDDPEKDVTLVLAFPMPEQKDTQKVVAEINKKLETLLPHTKIELLMDASMGDKWSLWMSTKKKIDLAHSGFVTDINREVLNESYLELNDLVEENAPHIQEVMKDYWYSYDNASINGRLYGIPNVQSHLREGMTLRVNKAFSEYIDTKALTDATYASRKTTTAFWQVLTDGLAAAEAAGLPVPDSIKPQELLPAAQRGYVLIGGEMSNICYDIEDPECKIINYYDTPEFAEFCQFAKLWAEKGWISPDVLTDTGFSKITALTGSRYQTDEETRLVPALIEGNSFYTYNLDNPDNDIVYTNVGENRSYYSIPFCAPNPARAMKFLDLLHSEEGKEIAQMLAFGLEGTHWEYTNEEKDEIKAFEYLGQGGAEASYGIPYWATSNMMLNSNLAPYTQEYKEYAKQYWLEHLNSADKHPLYGLSFDISGIERKLSNVLKNNDEYTESIYCGIVKNSDVLMKELTDKNNSAGFADIMTELQKQADDFLAKK